MNAKRWAVLSGLFIMILVLAAACSSGSDAEPADTPAAAVVNTTDQDEAYYAELAAAQALTRANFRNFGEIFSSSWPIRSALISALLDAGVGNAFFDGLEALKQIQPPPHLQTVHQSIVDANQRLYDLDSDAADAVRKGDLAAFTLINGQMSEVSLNNLMSLPAAVCNSFTPAEAPQRNPACRSGEPLPGGEYGEQLSNLLRAFEPRFGGASGVLTFPLSLSEEELIQVFSTISSDIEALVAEIQSGLANLTPPSSMQDDHQRLTGYFQVMRDGFSQVNALTSSGDITEARMILQSSQGIYCETRGSFASAEFKVLIGLRFQGGPMICEGQPF